MFKTTGKSVHSGVTSLAYYKYNSKLKIRSRVIISKLTLLVKKFRGNIIDYILLISWLIWLLIGSVGYHEWKEILSMILIFKLVIQYGLWHLLGILNFWILYKKRTMTGMVRWVSRQRACCIRMRTGVRIPRKMSRVGPSVITTREGRDKEVLEQAGYLDSSYQQVLCSIKRPCLKGAKVEIQEGRL